MSKDFKALLKLEDAAAAAGGKTPSILEDLQVIVTPAIRLLFLSFEFDQWRPNSQCGLHILKGLVVTLPDSKIVEDLHGVVRVDQQSQKNKRKSMAQIQELLTQSKVFRERGIPHMAAIDKDTFLSSFNRTADRKRPRRYKAASHRLPADWSKIMSRKTWGTLSPETLNRGTAAWVWLQHYYSAKLSEHGVRISYGCFSKFALDLKILEHAFDGRIGLCLGQATWGAIFWPLQAIELGNLQYGERRFYLCPNGGAFWCHLYEPQFWNVLFHEAELLDDQIYLRVHSDSQAPLLKCFFETKSHKTLQVEELKLLAEHLCAPPAYGDRAILAKMPRADLIHGILDHIGSHDLEWVANVKSAMLKPEPSTVDEADDDGLGNFLDELVLDDMPQEERRDYSDVVEAVNQKKFRASGWTMAEQKNRQKAVKPNPKDAKVATSKAKSKPRPKLSSSSKRAKTDDRVRVKLPKQKLFVKSSRKRKAESAAPIEDVIINFEPVQLQFDSEPHDVIENLEPPPEEREAAPVDQADDVIELAVPEAAEAQAPQAGLEAADPPISEVAAAPPAAAAAAAEAAPAVPAAAAADRAPAPKQLVWTDHFCSTCGQLVGQYKYAPCPGGRDPPTWFMRSRGIDGQFPQNGPNFVRRLATLVNEDDIHTWIERRAHCGCRRRA